MISTPRCRRLRTSSWHSSAATIRVGKAAFYQQIERPIAAAYDMTGETMACNMAFEDAAEGIDAFLQKRPAAWLGR